ncbi:MAG: rRNA pseudouridine synthase [Candidatus Zixiibacteriota bacterium]|nr:MAG: rRNA pseudouridine synthase [candidate division Zixibacteria bacterium]
MTDCTLGTVMIRLNKYLSLCGVTSRRGADALIVEGRVTVNDSRIEELGTLIDESIDVVKVDDMEVWPVAEQVYVVLNKPPGVMTTLKDPFGRKTIIHYLGDLETRVYPVGRLDYDTEGVLLLTNDGDLAYRLAHPKFQVKKVYEARVEGLFTSEAASQIERGIKLEDGNIGRGKVRVVSQQKNVTKIRLELTEGRKREVKQLCRATGHPVMQLRRREFAGITARGLKLGKWRHLNMAEVRSLKELVNL